MTRPKAIEARAWASETCAVHEVGFDGGEAVEVDRAHAVLAEDDLECLVGGNHGLGEHSRLLLGFQEGDQSVLDLLVGGQHGGAVVQQGLLELGILQADVVGQHGRS